MLSGFIFTNKKMTLTSTISDIAIQTIANLISNLAWFILIYWGVRTIAKNVPIWLEQYSQIRIKQRAIDSAMSVMRR